MSSLPHNPPASLLADIFLYNSTQIMAMCPTPLSIIYIRSTCVSILSPNLWLISCVLVKDYSHRVVASHLLLEGVQIYTPTDSALSAYTRITVSKIEDVGLSIEYVDGIVVVIRHRRRPFGLASQDVAGATWSGYRCRHVTRIPLAPCGHGP